jgi:hypothetical protein
VKRDRSRDRFERRLELDNETGTTRVVTTWIPEEPPDRPNVLECDMCNQWYDRLWEYPTRGFGLRFGGNALISNSGAWSCCTQCKVLFDAREWKLLAARAMTLFDFGHLTSEDLMKLYSVIGDAVSGPCKEWQSGQLYRRY